MHAAFKLLRAVLHLLCGYWIIRTQFSRIKQSQREAHVQRWSAQLMGILGVHLQLEGTPITSGLLVANHVSWLDNLAIHAVHFCRFVAKSDIKSWPVIGYLTEQSGMLFVERTSRKDAHRVVQMVAKRLVEGDCVAVFPEGTTGDGAALLPFHANMIQSAIDADSFVQAVAIKFVNSKTSLPSAAPLYVGEGTLLASVWRVLGAAGCGGVTAVLRFGVPCKAAGRDRRTFAADLRSSIQHDLATDLVVPIE
jgi:1-acyl-sn-glycerol-3-phosphate acyltransferase